jgi:hypothetical protein
MLKRISLYNESETLPSPFEHRTILAAYASGLAHNRIAPDRLSHQRKGNSVKLLMGTSLD